MGQFRGKKYDCNKNNEKAKQVAEKIKEINVVIKNNGFQGRFCAKEILNPFANIKHYGNGHNEQKNEHKCAKKFFDDIFIEFFQSQILFGHALHRLRRFFWVIN